MKIKEVLANKPMEVLKRELGDFLNGKMGEAYTSQELYSETNIPIRKINELCKRLERGGRIRIFRMDNRNLYCGLKAAKKLEGYLK